MSEADWDRVVDVNLKGTFFACSRAIPELKKTEGCIINLSSDAGLVGTPETAMYTASKGGVSVMTKALAIELAPHLVRVNAVCPADIMTPMLQYQADTYGGGDPEGYFKRLLTSYPQGGKARFITPEQVAELVFYLASPAGDAHHRRQRLHRLRHLGRVRLLVSALPVGSTRRQWMSRLPLLVLGVGVLLLFALVTDARGYSPGGDWRHLAQVAGRLSTRTPERPMVYLLGGSAARECTIDDRSWRAAIKAAGGPDTLAYNLGADGSDLRGQSGAHRDAAARAVRGDHRRDRRPLHQDEGPGTCPTSTPSSLPTPSTASRRAGSSRTPASARCSPTGSPAAIPSSRTGSPTTPRSWTRSWRAASSSGSIPSC